jgi:hypothetical protein
MPAYAVAFLDQFLGAEPDWILPDNPRSRRVVRDRVARSLNRSIQRPANG